MKYIRLTINKYKAVKDSKISIQAEPVPIIGVNEAGKSSALEAMAHFDYRNDTIADQKGWRPLNRYIPGDDGFSVNAEIEFDQAKIQAFIDGLTDEEKTQVTALIPATGNLTISRSFDKVTIPVVRKYSIGDHQSDLAEKLSREIVSKLPRIFYFDNFLENPFPNTILFEEEYFTDPVFQLNEHQIVVEGMFTDSGNDLKTYLNEPDENTKSTIIAAVNDHVTKKLIAEWKKMHFNPEDVSAVIDLSVSLQQNRANNRIIDINIIEKFKDSNGTERTISMLLSERSQGFRWFFNFSAKKCFGARGEEKFVYLFDEPGSYLHNGAQGVLLKAMCDLSQSHPVVFSTHSEFLLDPELININNIRVVEKTDREIKLIPLAQTKTKKHQGALSTLYNALRMKIPISSTLNQKVIITEGITDFYFWKMLIKNIAILPGFGAGQNEYLISIAIGTAKKYIALFDGDIAGEQAITKYKRFYGDDESINWKKYLDRNNSEVVLETLLSTADQTRLLTETGMTDLKKATTSLYFSDDAKKQAFWNGINNETKSNIKAVLAIIKTSLGLTGRTLFNYGLNT